MFIVLTGCEVPYAKIKCNIQPQNLFSTRLTAIYVNFVIYLLKNILNVM